MTYAKLRDCFVLPDVSPVAQEQAEIQCKYEGYIQKQEQAVAKALRLETKRIPTDFDYASLRELSGEAREKLQKYAPIPWARRRGFPASPRPMWASC